MRHLLITIAAVLMVGCGQKAPDISIHDAAKQHLGSGFQFIPIKLVIENGSMIIRFQAHPGNKYFLHTCDDLTDANWMRLDTNKFVTKIKTEEFIVSPNDKKGQKFYRVSKTAFNRSNSSPLIAGTKKTRAIPVLESRINLTPSSMKGGDPAAQALVIISQKDEAESVGVPMPPLPFQERAGNTFSIINKAPSIAIHWAARTGNIETVKQAIADGADVNQKFAGESTPLHTAIINGHKEVVKLLIVKGADVNQKFAGESTPLHTAIINGHKEVVKLLIVKGADVNAKDYLNITPLHIAAAKGDKEAAELLIAKDAGVNTRMDITEFSSGQTPLDLSIRFQNAKISNILRKHGGKTGKETEIKPSRRSSNYSNLSSEQRAKMRLTYERLTRGRSEIEKAIIKEQFAAEFRDGSGDSNKSTPAPEANPVEPVTEGESAKKVSEALKVLSSTRKGQILLSKTIKGNIEQVKQLLAEGVDVNTKSDDGSTPLFHAVASNENEIAELLIDKGADINVKDDTGITPLHIAKSDELFELLIANGADVNAKDKFGRTPFYYRSKRDSMRVNQVDSINTKPLDDNTIGPAMPPLPFVNELNEPEK